MKPLLLFVLLILINIGLTAQSTKFVQTMEKAIGELYTANQKGSLDPVINKFMRIGEAEKSEWEPFYYAGLGHVFNAFRIEDPQQRDEVLDLAMNKVNMASERSGNNVEIILLEGFINMIKIGVDPATRGQSLTPVIMASFQRALQMAPENPRASLFMAQMQMGTAQFFGTGIEESCQLVSRAVALFDSYEDPTSISPSWGKESALQLQAQCSTQSSDTGGN